MSAMDKNEEAWDIVITNKRALFDFSLRELVRYRDLIAMFIARDFTTRYKQTILGPLWFVLNPMFSAIAYAFLFGSLAKLSTLGVPHLVFYYSATMLWSFFSDTFSRISNIFVDNKNLFGKVYFPRLTVPVSIVAMSALKALVQFVFFMVSFFIFYLRGSDIHFSFSMFFFPLVLIWIAMCAVGMGMMISSMTTKYRDIKLLVDFALNLYMYATPVVYVLSEVPARYAWLSYINPLCMPFELFRLAYFGRATFSLPLIAVSLSESFVILILGLVMFNQNERNFIDIM